MRIKLLVLASIAFSSLRAQNHLPINSFTDAPWQSRYGSIALGDDSYLNNKWYLNHYAGTNAGLGIFNGVSGTLLSVPFGLQLNHPLNNNLVTFVGIAAAPAYFYSIQSFTAPYYKNSYPGGILYNPYGFGMSSRIEMGMMYINDAKTFSVSGSIGVERNSYLSYPPDHPNSKRK